MRFSKYSTLKYVCQIKTCHQPATTKHSHLCKSHNKIPKQIDSEALKLVETPIRIFVEAGRGIEWFFVHPFVGNESSSVKLNECSGKNDFRKHLTVQLCDTFKASIVCVHHNIQPDNKTEGDLLNLLHPTELCENTFQSATQQNIKNFFDETVSYLIRFPDFTMYVLSLTNPYYDMCIDAIVEYNLKTSHKQLELPFDRALKKAGEYAQGIFTTIKHNTNTKGLTKYFDPSGY